MIRFCFDYLSPYAYLAWTQVHRVAERHGAAVEPVPVLFAALLGAAGTKGPAEIPAKRVYVFKDCLRTAYRLGVPLVPPPTHPFHPLLALRVSSVDMDAEARRRLIDALFAAAWGGGIAGVHGVEDPGSVAAIADAVGLDGAALVAAAGTAEVKDRVRRNTDEAIASGAFGVPAMFVDGELFWGLDSLDNLEQKLRGETPPALREMGRWAGLAASAQRKG